MIKWLNNLFSNTKTDHKIDNIKTEVHEHQKSNINKVSTKFLIVGLGNIGAEYVNTRHNIGFKVVDFLAKKESLQFETVKLGALAEYKFKGRTFLLLKPNTYMNLSGNAVQYWMNAANIPMENVMIITDDLNLPFGTIRIRKKGSDGGHNGLKSVQSALNTNDYIRFRFGISDEFKKGKQVDYVLGEWDDSEKIALPERLELASEIIKSFGTAGIENTMTTFNGK
ncbi:aminoacyl-tRNA hydrolase [Flavobacterium sp.]|uniref:aminoacyl-tRNA hydrolase n=1 Tax=Flavobacterium sp. TaxID=239 RepID=UPI00286EA99A|nr:aminoacyl-tRNA hydrolase [Flavobacterium sp.]